MESQVHSFQLGVDKNLFSCHSDKNQLILYDSEKYLFLMEGERMLDLYGATFGQIPQLTTTFTVSPPDILGNVSISGLNGTVGTISQGVLGESYLEMDGERIATIQDSVYGDYQITTDEGTYTAMDNVYGGDTLFHFGEAVAQSRPGLFGAENWYDTATNELLATTSVNGLGQATITVPSYLEPSSYDVMDGLNSFSTASDMTDLGDILSGSTDFLDFLDFI